MREDQKQLEPGESSRIIDYSCPAREREPKADDRPAFGYLALLALICGAISLTIMLLAINPRIGLGAYCPEAVFWLSILGAPILAVLSLVRGRQYDWWNRAMAIAALILVAVPILWILGVKEERQRGNWYTCIHNLRWVDQGIHMYANDYGGQYPQRLDLLISIEDIPTDRFVCPSSDDTKATGPTTQAMVAQFNKPGHCSYVYVGAGLTSATVTAETVIAYESTTNHKGEGTNVLYGDGTIRCVARTEAEYIISELKAGRNPPATRPAK